MILYINRFQTGYGDMILMKSPAGLCFVGLPGASLEEAKLWGKKHFKSPEFIDSPDNLRTEREQLQEYLAGRRRDFDLTLDIRHAPFSKKVLRAVAEVNYGQTATYGGIARQVGSPRASRAVGRANATNPLPIVIGCHRILGSDGSLTGYGGGIELKKALLRLEQQPA
ncbi:methylated-DNA--[protein]-cysteine S-methyltransferase [Candidatus Neomarinimicrobiota bacterium]